MLWAGRDFGILQEAIARLVVQDSEIVRQRLLERPGIGVALYALRLLLLSGRCWRVLGLPTTIILFVPVHVLGVGQ